MHFSTDQYCLFAYKLRNSLIFLSEFPSSCEKYLYARTELRHALVERKIKLLSLNACFSE